MRIQDGNKFNNYQYRIRVGWDTTGQWFLTATGKWEWWVEAENKPFVAAFAFYFSKIDLMVSFTFTNSTGKINGKIWLVMWNSNELQKCCCVSIFTFKFNYKKTCPSFKWTHAYTFSFRFFLYLQAFTVHSCSLRF